MPRHDTKNLSRYWRDRRTPGLTLLRADFTTHEYAPHTHDALVIVVTEDGGSQVKSRGTVQAAMTSTLFVFNPDEPHAGWMGWSHRWLYRGLYLTQSALDDVASGLGIDRIPYFSANAFTDTDLIAAFLKLHYALEESGDALHDRELLVGSFGTLFRRHGSDGAALIRQARADRAALSRVIEIMQDRHAEALKLEELAATASLTQFQLIGLFNRLTGMSPHAYLTQIRLKAACRLLKRGAVPAEAATAAGFYDQSALNRHFKRAYGITPLQYASAA